MEDLLIGLVLGAYNRTTHDKPVELAEVLDVLVEDNTVALMDLFDQSYLRGYQQGIIDGVMSYEKYQEIQSET